MFKRAHTNRGLIKAIVLILIALLILAYFGFNLRSIVNSATFQDNWNFLWNGIVHIWDTYLKAPATYLWDIFINYIWNPAIHNLQNGHGVPLDDPSHGMNGVPPTVQ